MCGVVCVSDVWCGVSDVWCVFCLTSLTSLLMHCFIQCSKCAQVSLPSTTILRTSLPCPPCQVDTRGEDGSTALHHASVKGRSECIEVLLGAGATVDARTARGETPLHLATMYSTGGAVALLVDMGRADLSVRHPHLDSRCIALCACACVCEVCVVVCEVCVVRCVCEVWCV